MVSIIIPTYNRQGPLLRAVDSVLIQTFLDFELIIIDDGSTDNTEKWLTHYNDKRLSYYKTTNKGVSHARNFGVNKAKFDWICFLDSDDVWHKNKLKEQVLFHQQNPEILISQTDDIWIRNGKRVNKMKKHMMREGNIFKESLRMCLVCPSSVMLTKKLFLKVGGFDEKLKVCEDYDLWLRILANHIVGYINKPLITKFGGHDDQLSKALPVMDEYRVYTLKKLLKLGSLTKEQTTLVKDEINFKLKIIEQGKQKRKT